MGGLLGLCMGLSFVSVVEVVFYLAQFIFSGGKGLFIKEREWLHYKPHGGPSELINLLNTLIHPLNWNFISKLAGTPSKLAPWSDKLRALFELFLTSNSFVSCSEFNLHQFNRNVDSWNRPSYNIYILQGNSSWSLLLVRQQPASPGWHQRGCCRRDPGRQGSRLSWWDFSGQNWTEEAAVLFPGKEIISTS